MLPVSNPKGICSDGSTGWTTLIWRGSLTLKNEMLPVATYAATCGCREVLRRAKTSAGKSTAVREMEKSERGYLNYIERSQNSRRGGAWRSSKRRRALNLTLHEHGQDQFRLAYSAYSGGKTKSIEQYSVAFFCIGNHLGVGDHFEIGLVMSLEAKKSEAIRSLLQFKILCLSH